MTIPFAIDNQQRVCIKFFADEVQWHDYLSLRQGILSGERACPSHVLSCPLMFVPKI
jgi:hypothetical protein